MTPPDRTPIEVPADATVIELHKMTAHMNAEWAQRDPHAALQYHQDCEIGECVAKTVAWGELVRCGELPMDTAPLNRDGGEIRYLHNEDGLTAIGRDGFPYEGEGPELEPAAPLGELNQYAVIDIEPEAVIDNPAPPTRTSD